MRPYETELIPRETELVPRETDIVHWETEFIPNETEFIPRDTDIVHWETEFILHETGFVPRDTGFIPPDTGFVPRDTGFVPPDTGFVPRDTGFVPRDTGFVQRRGYLYSGGGACTAEGVFVQRWGIFGIFNFINLSGGLFFLFWGAEPELCYQSCIGICCAKKAFYVIFSGLSHIENAFFGCVEGRVAGGAGGINRLYDSSDVIVCGLHLGVKGGEGSDGEIGFVGGIIGVCAVESDEFIKIFGALHIAEVAGGDMGGIRDRRLAALRL